MRIAARATVYAGILVAPFWASAACGQSIRSSGAIYGRGVDAYFSGNSAEAELNLSQAIQELPDDPRPYYFRALALLRSGRRDEAISDMQIGASLEAQRPKQFGVGTALERIQGGDRLLLEQYRRQARDAATIEGDVPSHQRSDWTIPSDAAVLRHPPATDSPSKLARPQSATIGSGNPFADDAPKPSLPAATPSDPFAAEPPKSSATSIPGRSPSSDKLPPGKLMGVLGRVLERTVPLPSVEGLRNELPNSSSVPSPSGPTAPSTSPSHNKQPNAANDTEDPFGAP
jgi:hypothetical protein